MESTRQKKACFNCYPGGLMKSSFGRNLKKYKNFQTLLPVGDFNSNKRNERFFKVNKKRSHNILVDFPICDLSGCSYGSL